MQLSKKEDSAYKEMIKRKIFVFKIKDLCLLLKLSRMDAYNLVKSLKRKKVIRKAGNGFFVFDNVDDFVIATSIHFPSYISFSTALSYYGFSDQMPKKIFLASTKYTKEVLNFKYITFSKKRFFGYKMIGDIVIAEKEKAIIDSLLFPKYSGGMKEVMKVMEKALHEMEVNKFVEYLFRIGNKAVLRRAGYLFELYEERKYKKQINKLIKHIGRGYEKFDPNQKRKNNLNKRWLLDINL